MTAKEAEVVAITKGLTLVRADNPTSFRHVSYEADRDKYRAKLRCNGEDIHLDRFHTAKEAVLCTSRWLRDHPASDGPPLMTAKEAEAAVTTEGLTLVRADNPTGF